jgi:hypothetical protein
LSLERLEDRTTPTVHTWTGTAGTGLWSDPGNWTGGSPTSAEPLPTGTVVVFPIDAQTTHQDIAGLTVDEVQFTGKNNVIALDTSLGIDPARAGTRFDNQSGGGALISGGPAALVDLGAGDARTSKLAAPAP